MMVEKKILFFGGYQKMTYDDMVKGEKAGKKILYRSLNNEYPRAW